MAASSDAPVAALAQILCQRCLGATPAGAADLAVAVAAQRVDHRELGVWAARGALAAAAELDRSQEAEARLRWRC